MAAPSPPLGTFVTLTVDAIGPHGAFLDGPDKSSRVLLPGGEIPEGVKVGDALLVFVCLDSEERPIATTKRPKLALDEVAFLDVTAVAPFGAFVDWGIGKELLVPFKEQTSKLAVGDRAAIALYVDDTGRLAGTMRVRERLHEPEPGEFQQGEWVLGEAWRKEPERGVFVIVEKRFVGLLPESEPHALGRGDAARFRIARILPDGKIELSLRAHAHEQAGADADAILKELARKGAPPIRESASPDEIRARFALSKKAFKRAVGGLLRRGDAQIAPDGTLRLSRPPTR